MLVSTDLRKLRAGTHGMPPGLPWAVVSAVGFGIAAFLLGYASQQAGWESGLWGSRLAQVACYVPIAFLFRRQLAALRPGVGLWVALAAGAADLLGVVTYSAGAESGYLTIVLAASAVFPMIAVVLSIALPARTPGAEPVRRHRAGGRRAAAAGVRVAHPGRGGSMSWIR